MSINKRFAHLNHSGSNHSILDAESAYITGTLQVGPGSIPGTDTNFFVSGNIGGQGGATPGVGVFGGDLVVSGTIYGLGGISGAESYWGSETVGEIFTSASLVNVPSGSVHAQFLSASNGAEITGSFVVSGSGVIFDFNLNSADEVVVRNDNTGDYVKLTTGSISYNNGINPDKFEIYSANDLNVNALGDIFITASIGNMYVGADTVFEAGLSGSLQMLADGTTMFLTGAGGIQITNLANGQIEISGSVSGGGAGNEYWFSTGSNEVYTTGSVLLRAGLAASPALNLIEFDVSGSDIQTYDGYGSFYSQNGAFIQVKDVIEADPAWNQLSGSINIYAANVYASGSGGDVYVAGGTGGWDNITARNGGRTFINGGVGGSTTGLSVAGSGGDIYVTGGRPGWSGGAYQAGEEAKAGDIYINGGLLTDISRSLSGSSLLFGDGNGGGGFSSGFRYIGFDDYLQTHLTSEQDTYFFVSGSINAKNTSDRGVAVFGGDLVVSGGLYAENKLQVRDGGQLIAAIDNNIGQASFYVSITGSNGMLLTGALNVNPAGTGRGLLNFGGLDIGPITGSAFTSDAGIGGYNPNTILGGNLLSASFGVWQPGAAAMLRHEVHVVGFGQNLLAGGTYNTFAATYLVSSFVDAAGNQNVIGATELSRETSGSNASTWDVNFAVNGDIEVSGVLGSIGTGLSDIVNWYGQRVKEMSINISGSRT